MGSPLQLAMMRILMEWEWVRQAYGMPPDCPAPRGWHSVSERRDKLPLFFRGHLSSPRCLVRRLATDACILIARLDTPGEKVQFSERFKAVAPQARYSPCQLLSQASYWEVENFLTGFSLRLLVPPGVCAPTIS